MKNKLQTAGIGLCLLLCLRMPATAQQTTIHHSISGTVLDSASHQPLEMVTVQLLDAKRKPVKTVLTQAGGHFKLKDLPDTVYLLQVTATGFRVASRTVGLQQAELKLEPVWLQAASAGLKEVVVTARPLVKKLIDGISYDLQADPESNSSSVLEMMRKIPFLSVDAGNNVLLKGNGNYKIFINGKPSSLMERNPQEVLRSMPASSIQRIEVITAPSAKYDAEGFAGIINIITNKKAADSYNGSWNLNERFPAGGPGTGGSLSVRQGRLGLSAYAGGSLQRTPSTTNRLERSATGDDAGVLLQQGTRRSHNRNGYLGTELSWDVDSLRLVSMQFNLNGSRYTGVSTLQSQLSGKEYALQQAYDLLTNSRNNGSGIDAAVNFQQGFKKDKNRLLTFSYRYFRYNSVQNDQLGFSGKVNYTQPDYRQRNDAGANEHTFQVDYVHPFKKLTMEAGVKGIARSNESDYGYLSFNSSTGWFEPDSSMGNRFNNHQYIFSAYNSWLYSKGKWDVRAGLRAEQTFTSVDFISTATKVKQQYFNIIPSFVISRKLGNNSSLNMDFTQRIKRPGINRLNPFVDRSNPSEESSGNPNLKAVLNNRIQAGYSRWGKLSLNLSVDYNIVNKLDLKLTSFDSAAKITRSTYANTGKARAGDFSININYQLNQRINMGVNSTLTYVVIDGYINGNLVKQHWWLYSANYFMGYKLNKGWRLNMNASLTGPNPAALQSMTNKMLYTSVSVNKELVKGKLNCSAFINNPFTRYRHNKVNTTGPGFVQYTDEQQYFRSFGCSLNYHFGKLKNGVKKSSRQIRNDDVSNGKGL